MSLPSILMHFFNFTPVKNKGEVSLMGSYHLVRFLGNYFWTFARESVTNWRIAN